MNRTEHQRYLRNRNFITGMFAGYLTLVKWTLILLGGGMVAIFVGSLVLGPLFAPAKPVAQEIVTGPCERTFTDPNDPWKTITPPDRKKCRITMVNPNGTEWYVSRVVPMTDWQWAELQDTE